MSTTITGIMKILNLAIVKLKLIMSLKNILKLLQLNFITLY